VVAIGKFDRHIRRRRSAPSVVAFDTTKLSLEDATIAAARAQGCVCEPELSGIDWPHVTILHDQYCPLARIGDVN